MTTRTLSKIAFLSLGAVLSATWLSTIVVGMQAASTPAPRAVELPPVVVIGHKSAALDATALGALVMPRKA